MTLVYAYADMSVSGNDVDDVCNIFVSFDSMRTYKRFCALRALDNEGTHGMVLLAKKKYNCGVITAEDMQYYKRIRVNKGYDAAYKIMNLGDELWDTLTEAAFCVDMVDTYGAWGNAGFEDAV